MQQSHCRAFLTSVLAVLACACLASAGNAAGAARTAGDDSIVSVERVSDGVVVASPPFGRNNVTAIATQKGLVLLDAGACPSIASKLKRAIEKRLGRSDWAYLINTHVHDHTGGNVLFKDLPIIGHENTVADTRPVVEFLASPEKLAPTLNAIQEKIREAQKKLDGGAGDGDALRAELAYWRDIENDASKGFELVVPNVRFTDELTLDMGDVTIHALYVGGGHSASDVVVHVPEKKLLVAGSSCGPFFPKVGETVRLADLSHAVAVLDRILQGGVEQVVPAHAEVAGRELAERRRDYYRDLVAGVKGARGEGLTLEKAQETLGLERRFAYMSDVKPFQGTAQEMHAANVAAVWKLVQP